VTGRRLGRPRAVARTHACACAVTSGRATTSITRPPRPRRVGHPKSLAARRPSVPSRQRDIIVPLPQLLPRSSSRSLLSTTRLPARPQHRTAARSLPGRAIVGRRPQRRDPEAGIAADAGTSPPHPGQGQPPPWQGQTPPKLPPPAKSGHFRPPIPPPARGRPTQGPKCVDLILSRVPSERFQGPGCKGRFRVTTATSKNH
jgi:hypothetical protein